MTKNRLFFSLAGLLFWSGCAGLSMRTTAIDFEDPFARLGIVNVQPNAEEAAGIELKFLPPAENVRNSTEEMKIYTRVQDHKGTLMKLVQTSKETYLPGSRPDSSVIRSESKFQGQSGSVLEELEVTRRGEIIKLIQGKHDSRNGKFIITSWTRTPVLPDGPVRLGNAWNYEESMEIQLDSLLLKQKGGSPYKIFASSKLAGFSEVRGHRCAVIETEADQIETQRFTMLGKEVTLYIRAKIRENLYLDYKAGMVMAKIAKAQTFTNSSDSKINDESLSQSVSYTTA